MPEADVWAIARLLGDLAVLPGGRNAKRRRLLDRLCQFVGADGWSWSLERLGQTGPAKDLPGRPSALSAAVGRLRGRPCLFPLRPRSDLTVRQIAGGLLSSIRLSRQDGRPRFSPRERQIARIVLSEIPWLHERTPSCPVPSVPGLTPRQRATLLHLAGGLGRRAIAQRLHLSPHTVDSYVKEIYRHYHVNSRAALVKRFSMIGGAEATA